MVGEDDPRRLYDCKEPLVALTDEAVMDRTRENGLCRKGGIRIGVVYPLLAATLCYGTALASGDGSNEEGFVYPPKDRQLPSPPPRSISSSETTISCCCCVAPLARTEAKKPPQPPVAITKLSH
jgi:hypothetical protein